MASEQAEEIKCVELGENFKILNTPTLVYIDTRRAIFSCRVAIASRFKNAYLVIKFRGYASLDKMHRLAQELFSRDLLLYRNTCPRGVRDPLGITIL